MHSLIISLVLLTSAEQTDVSQADAVTDVDETPAPVAAVDADGTPWEAAPLLTAEGTLTSTPVLQPSLPASTHYLFGAQVDVGLPDGLAASLSVSPLAWLRFSIGGLTNAAAFGVRASVLVMPWHGVFRPTLSLDGGHYFPGNVASTFGISGAIGSPLSRVSYDFASGHLGFEVGSQRLSFFLRAGASYLDGTTAPLSSDGFTTGPIHFRSLLPSLKLGVSLCFG